VLQAGTLEIFVFTWCAVRGIDLFACFAADRLKQTAQDATLVLLRPVITAAKIVVATVALLVWLDNLGFKVSTLLTGLGVGGFAVALAAQDTLKNLFGSIMILLDKPFHVGQRVVAKDHDGVVEEIGLRSTKLRLLTGHQATIPNEDMAKLHIENIGRRPHIRRQANIRLSYNTPPEKVERAVSIIQGIIENHEGMEPDFPPKVCFNEFNPDCLNILMMSWYHPPDYWAFNALNQRVNLEIMREFEKEGIQFALPSSATYLAQEEQSALQVNLVGDPR
jgi:MscS family membrane protein